MNAQSKEVIQTPMSELIDVQKAVAEINRVEAGLAALREEYCGVLYEVATTRGMEAAKAARSAVREPRYEVERIRKAAKAPILALGKKLDSEAARITAELEQIENPIHQQIKLEEDRKEAEREAKVQTELARVAEIQRLIDGIRNWPLKAANQPSSLVTQMLKSAVDYQIDVAVFQEFTQTAEQALVVSTAALTGLLAERKAHEAAAEQLKRDQEELARLRADQVAREASEKAAREAEALSLAEVRAQREVEERQVQEANRLRNEMAMQELQSIHHQLIIADTGRAPYCKGGDIQTMDWLLEQTEKWPITKEKFGALLNAAEKAKETVLTNLRKKRSDLFERERQLAEARANAEKVAAEKAANDRIAEAERQANAAEAARLVAQREAIEREGQERRLAAQWRMAAEQEAAHKVQTIPDDAQTVEIKTLDDPAPDALTLAVLLSRARYYVAHYLSDGDEEEQDRGDLLDEIDQVLPREEVRQTAAVTNGNQEEWDEPLPF